MKTKFANCYNALAAAILSVLGFSSCDNEGGECLYGTPTSDYHFKGKVTAEDGTPIPGIKVVTLEDRHDDEGFRRVDSTLTDKDGNYETSTKESHSVTYALKDNTLKVSFEDIDGEENGGTFATDTAKGKELEAVQIKKGDGSWYAGEYEITANKTLKRKK